MDGVNLESAVALYMALKAELENLDKEYSEKKKVITDKQDLLEAFFRSEMMRLGLTKLPTAAGTPYISVIKKFKVTDRNAYIQWAIANNFYEGFTNTLNKNAIIEYMEQNNAAVPPGLEMSQISNVNVRAS